MRARWPCRKIGSGQPSLVKLGPAYRHVVVLHQSDCSEKWFKLTNRHREPACRFLGTKFTLLAQLIMSVNFTALQNLSRSRCTKHNSTAPFNATACVLPGTIRRDPSGVKVMRRKKEERASSIHIRNCFVPPLCEETNRHKLQQLPLQPCSQALGSFILPTQEPGNVATTSKELYVWSYIDSLLWRWMTIRNCWAHT